MDQNQKNLKKELLVATADSLALSFVCAMIAGGNTAANGFGLFSGTFVLMALFHTYRANIRFEMYKDQK